MHKLAKNILQHLSPTDLAEYLCTMPQGRKEYFQYLHIALAVWWLENEKDKSQLKRLTRIDPDNISLVIELETKNKEDGYFRFRFGPINDE